jgi:hypothetical protein
MRNLHPYFQEENFMKRHVLASFLFVASLVIIVGLACSSVAPTTQVAATEPVVVQPSNTSQPVEPTSTPKPTDVPPTFTATPRSPFFKEEFDTDVLSSWSSFIITGDNKADKSKGSFSIDGGKLVFDLEDEQLYSYLIYDDQTYKDVRLEVSADNRGKNNNNISLVCRYTNDGWYEFSVMSSGLFQVWAVDLSGAVHKGYNLVNSGGSNAIKMGMETNVYSIVCSGDQLTLYINGEKATTFTESKYGFSDGKVGINVSSLNVIPIIVEFEYFDIQQP